MTASRVQFLLDMRLVSSLTRTAHLKGHSHASTHRVLRVQHANKIDIRHPPFSPKTL